MVGHLLQLQQVGDEVKCGLRLVPGVQRACLQQVRVREAVGGGAQIVHQPPHQQGLLHAPSASLELQHIPPLTNSPYTALD